MLRYDVSLLSLYFEIHPDKDEDALILFVHNTLYKKRLRC
jgi:hypothetical protein